MEKAGFETAYQIAPTWIYNIPSEREIVCRLAPAKDAPKDMVRVPGGSIALAMPGLDHLPDVALEDYWIDRHEVTNAEYRKFVEAGGYSRPDFWKQPLVENGRTLSWTEAVARFRDATGRPGPAVWELGTYPQRHGGAAGRGCELVRGRGVCGVRRQEPPDDLSLEPRGADESRSH